MGDVIDDIRNRITNKQKRIRGAVDITLTAPLDHRSIVHKLFIGCILLRVNLYFTYG